MKNLILAALVLAALSCAAQSGSKTSNYHQYWKLIEQNDLAGAQKLLTDGKMNPDKALDAYITSLYIKAYQQQADQVTDFLPAFYDKSPNPDPYLYALWFNQPVLGAYGHKTKAHQINLIKRILDNPKTHGTLRAAAHYQFGLHYVFQGKIDSANAEFNQMGGIKNRQYVGPFENLSGSGIYKSYGPLEKPDGKSEFLSTTHAKVKWFTPPHETPDGWTPFVNQFEENTGVTYAQTFVSSTSDRDILLNVGCTGAVRVWINDALLISEVIERITELDTYTVKCKLKKGVNRILVQLSFSDKTFPNFGVRLTDEGFAPIPELKGSSDYKPYIKASQSAVPVKHFAESFFENKLKQEPDNLLNHLLLADVYLRNRKLTEAREVIESALTQSDNNLLRFKLIEILNLEGNNTVKLEHVDKIRRTDPKASTILEQDITEFVNTERFSEATDLLAEYEKLYGESMKVLSTKMGIYAKQKRMNELVSIAEYSYKKYPYQPQLVQLMFAIQKEVYRDKAAAMKVYSDYLSHTYDYNLYNQYTKLLHEEGNTAAVKQKREWLVNSFPHETSLLKDLATYHLQAKEYNEAEKYLRKALDLSPYHQRLWDLLGDVKREGNAKGEAIASYQKSLQYNPNQYEVIAKLRQLQGKKEIHLILPQVDIKEAIAKDVPPADQLTTDLGYYVIHEDQSLVMHPGGATEDYRTLILRIVNKNGIEAYKESHIPYTSSQRLFIEQFDLIKKTGATIRGERSENQIVFTNLEAGDVIVYRYRIQNFVGGRFANDLWSKRFLQDECYVANLRYSVLIPATRKMNYVATNSKLQPTISDIEDFKKYTWTVTNQPGYKSEPYMPAPVDIAGVVHISTLNTWSDIASWYADLINKSSDETFELNAAFRQIFPDEGEMKALNEFQRARLIYNFIEENIRYSSVDFRQGAYLPQTASKTLATRLGDCKDLSNLFMKLCEMAGLQAQMVLTATRDNGEMDMMLPSLNFNHCISKVMLDGKTYFIELTDNQLPFASLPNSLMGAMVLEIPRKADAMKTVQLQKLQSPNRSRDIAKSNLVIRPDGNDLIVEVERKRSGHLTSPLRGDFSHLPYDKQVLTLHDYIGSQNQQASVDTLILDDLAPLVDSLSMRYRYTLRDVVSEIGSIKTFKLIFPDVVATSNHFVSADRQHAVNYPAYEDADYYETSIQVEIPDGKKLLEVPADVTLDFGEMKYQLRYAQDKQNKLLVTRTFSTKRVPVEVKDYSKLKTFLDNIVKAEQRMIAIQ